MPAVSAPESGSQRIVERLHANQDAGDKETQAIGVALNAVHG
jgi:hypothetical protein